MDYLLFGAIGGDICGSLYEHKAFRTKDPNKVDLFRKESTFTDDTVCTIGVADAIMNKTPFGETIAKWCKKYRNRGYGAMFGKWIDENQEPYGSYGNGSAMRVSPCGYAGKDLENVLQLAEEQALCSHGHPEGIKGAQAIAGAMYKALFFGKDEIEKFVKNYYPMDKSLYEIRPTYTFNATCQGSVPEAIQCFLESKDYEDCLKQAIAFGGDSDTQAAMSGSIAYPFYGYMDAKLLDFIYDKLPQEIITVVEEFDDYTTEMRRLYW